MYCPCVQRAHTWAVPGRPSSARTGETQSTAPVASRRARSAAAVRSSRCASMRVTHVHTHSIRQCLAASPPLRAPRAPKGLHESFSRPFPAALPRHPWIAQDIQCGLAEFQQVPIPRTSPHRPAPALRLRHSVGRFRFTFPALTLCMYLTCADINSTHRARSRVPPVRRGAAPSSQFHHHLHVLPRAARPHLSQGPRSCLSQTYYTCVKHPHARGLSPAVRPRRAPARPRPPHPRSAASLRRAMPVRSSRCAAVRVTYVHARSTPQCLAVSPPLRAPRGPKGPQVPFSPPSRVALPRRPWIAQDM